MFITTKDHTSSLFVYRTDLDSGDEYTNFLITVAEQRNHFSDVYNQRPALAQNIQKCLCLPSEVDLTNAIDTSRIK